MGRALIAAAWAASLAPCLLAGDALAALDDRSRFALSLAPWLFVAGVPRRTAWSWGVAAGLACTALAAAAWLDLRGGASGALLAQRAAWGAAAGGLAWDAAERARGGALHARLWFVGLAALPAAAVLAAWLDPGGASAARAWIAAPQPAARLLGAAADPALGALDLAAPAAALLLLAAARVRKAYS